MRILRVKRIKLFYFQKPYSGLLLLFKKHFSWFDKVSKVQKQFIKNENQISELRPK